MNRYRCKTDRSALNALERFLVDDLNRVRSVIENIRRGIPAGQETTPLYEARFHELITEERTEFYIKRYLRELRQMRREVGTA